MSVGLGLGRFATFVAGPPLRAVAARTEPSDPLT
jgi:hypothetical protein